MTLADALEARLRAVEAIMAATGGRIGTSRRLAKLPAITILVVSDPRPQHFTGFQSSRPSQVQVDVWSNATTPGATLRRLIVDALTPSATIGTITFQRAMIANLRSGYEQERGSQTPRTVAEVYRESIDFIFTHNAN